LADQSGPVYRRLRARAMRDTLDDAFAEAMVAARLDLRSEDEKRRTRAFEAIFRTYASLHRHRDRRRVHAGEKAMTMAWLDTLSDEELEALARDFRPDLFDDEPPGDPDAGEPARPKPPAPGSGGL